MSVNALGGTTFGAAQTEGYKQVFKSDEPVSIMEFDAGKASKTVDIDQISTDGNDDGKLSAGQIAKLAVKGAGEDVKNALTSPLGIIGIIGFTALSICPVTAPFVAPLAVAGAAIGIGAGAIKTVSGVGKMMSAESDAEAKGGAKEMGSGIYTTGVSAATMKASLNQMAKVEGSHMQAAYKNGTSKTKAYFQDVKEMVTEINPFPRKGNLSQKEIDEIFDSYKAEQAQIEANADTNMSQADIDDLLAHNGLGPNAPKDSLSQTEIDGILKQAGLGPDVPENNMSQADIDALLARNGLGPNAQAQPAPAAEPPAPAPAPSDAPAPTGGATDGKVYKFGDTTTNTSADKLTRLGKMLGIPDEEVAQLPDMIKWFNANGGDHTQTLLPDIIAAYKAAHPSVAPAAPAPAPVAEPPAPAPAVVQPEPTAQVASGANETLRGLGAVAGEGIDRAKGFGISLLNRLLNGKA